MCFAQIKRICQTEVVIVSLCLTEVLSLQSHATPNSSQSSVAETNTPLSQTVIYVNPALGKDELGAGLSVTAPLDTIAYALQQVEPGTTIQLAPGNYSPESGEVFPLVLKEGITLQGDESNHGQSVVIFGGGLISSSYFGRQNATIWAAKDSKISGLTVTNPNRRGTGLWIESTNPVVTNSTFKDSLREGIFVTGTGQPQVKDNVFINNDANGISVDNSAQGEIRANVFERTGFGLAVGGTAAPLVINNRITENTDGFVISGSARPVLRNNHFENNARDGIVTAACSQPQLDLGTTVNSGGNIFSNNGRYDINNGGGSSLVAIGNQLDPSRVAGLVNLGVDSRPTILQEQQHQCS